MTLIEAISQWNSTKCTRLTIVDNNGRCKVQVDLLKDYDTYGDCAYIWDLYVKEEYRRQGLAKELMQNAIQRAKDFGYNKILLEWDLRDTTIEIAKWYLSMGFIEEKFGNGYALMVNTMQK